MSVVREAPDTRRAAEFDGEPMVQSFLVPGGRVWITTAEALQVPAFGREWMAGRLNELESSMGKRAFKAAVRRGLRVRVESRELALAA